MKRRDFLKGASAVTAGASIAATVPAVAQEKKVYQWKMVTTWPKNFPGVGTTANFLAKKIEQMSDGQIVIKVYGAGELVPAMECLDAVSTGTAEIAHGASYYWKGKAPAVQFFASIPYGLTAQEMNSWLYAGDGLKLWQEVYAPFNVIPFPAGNSGVQMGGWFNKDINSVEDLKGLKMRIPGLGGEVLKRAGGTSVALPGGEIFTALQSGVIDATEWVGPYNDLAFGLYKVAKKYYYPGWQESGSVAETFVNKDIYDALPKELQAVISDAARIANQQMLAEYNANNGKALKTLVEEHGVELKKFPDDVLKKLKEISAEVLAEIAGQDPMSKKVYDSFIAFREDQTSWSEISERAYLNARIL